MDYTAKSETYATVTYNDNSTATVTATGTGSGNNIVNAVSSSSFASCNACLSTYTINPNIANFTLNTTTTYEGSNTVDRNGNIYREHPQY